VVFPLYSYKYRVHVNPNAAIIAGPLATILSKLFLTLPLDPVFPGLFAALLIMAAGLAVGKVESAGK
jgi:hypothetical protein